DESDAATNCALRGLEMPGCEEGEGVSLTSAMAHGPSGIMGGASPRPRHVSPKKISAGVHCTDRTTAELYVPMLTFACKRARDVVRVTPVRKAYDGPPLFAAPMGAYTSPDSVKA